MCEIASHVPSIVNLKIILGDYKAWLPGHTENTIQCEIGPFQTTVSKIIYFSISLLVQLSLEAASGTNLKPSRGC